MEKLVAILEKNKTIALFLILVFTTLVYLNTFTNQFVWDDPDFFVKWEGIRSLNNIPSYFAGNVPSRHIGVYRPVRSVFQALNYQFFGQNPFGYHLNGLTIHLLVVILVYFLVREITKKNLLAFLAAILFGLHPIHTEAITFITTSFDEIGVIFFLLSFYLYLRSFDKGSIKRVFYLSSIMLALLAFFTYEITLVLPLILILYDFYFKDFPPKTDFRQRTDAAPRAGKPRDLLKRAKFYLPYFLGAFFYIFVRFFWLKIASRQLTKEGNLDFFSRIFTSSKAVVKYIFTLIFPAKLNVYNNLPNSHSLFEPAVFLAIILILILFALAVIFFKKYKLISFGIFWFFITLLPVANIIPIQTFYAEKYVYLSSLGFCLILGFLIYRIYRYKMEESPSPSWPKILAVFVFMVIVLFYAQATWSRNAEWKDEITLWQATLKKYPDSSRAHNNLGFEFYKQKKYEVAIAEFEKAVELESDFAPAYNNLGNVYQALRAEAKAAEYYQKAIELDPNYAEAYSNLGVAFHSQGEFEKAILNYQKALELDKNYYLALSNWGAAYLLMKNYELAAEKFQQAIAQSPNLPESYNGLGLAYVNLGQLEPALAAFKKAVELKPDFLEVYNYLGIIYALKGEYQTAKTELEKALKINPDYLPARENLEQLKSKLP